MSSMLWAWAISAVVLTLAAVYVGFKTRSRAWGMFVDSRGRFSLTHLQVMTWTIVVVSLIFGVFFGRLLDEEARSAGALSFAIPNELLLVMGISVGSAVTATVIKTGKDASGAPVATRDVTGEAPSPAQAVMVEEGSSADEAIDVSKFQSFWITILLVIAYVSLAIAAISSAESPAAVTLLPAFDDAFIVLLGISHAGYLAGKLPTKPGPPPGAVEVSANTNQAGTTRVAITSPANADLRDVRDVKIAGVSLPPANPPSRDRVEVDLPQGLNAGGERVTLIAPGWSTTSKEAVPMP